MKRDRHTSYQLEWFGSLGASQQTDRVWVRPTKRLVRTTPEMADEPTGAGTSGATTAQTIDEMIRASLARVLREDLNTLLEKIVTEKLASQSPSSEKTPTPSEARNMNEGQCSTPEQRRAEKGKAPMPESPRVTPAFTVNDSSQRPQDESPQGNSAQRHSTSHEKEQYNEWRREYEKKPDMLYEEVIKRLQRLEGSTIYDVNSWYQSPEEQLPPKFKYPEMTKYDGSGPPKAHIMMYMGCMKPMGISDNMLAHLFQRSLVGNALEWFVELDRSKYPTWPMLADAFIKHFSYGGDTRVTRRQLEAMQQGPNESFTDYIARWRRKVREMIDRPSEEEQIAIIRKNLRPNYQKVMSVVTKTRLDKFIQAGTQVEDSLKNETSAEPRGKKVGKEHVNYISNGQGQHRPFQVQPNRSEQNNQQNQIPQAHQTNQGNPQGNQGNGRNKPKREFSKLNHPMSMLLVGLLEAGLVTHKPPVRAPKTPQAWYNPDQYCSFHQSPGHLTDNCWALKHEIQNLLDSGKISMEGVQVPRKPNINTNPLPNHQMEGQKNVNYVGTEDPVDPTKLIRRRETTEVAAIYSTQPDRSSEYQLGEPSQRPLTLSELAARGKKLELERQWPIQTKEMGQKQEREQENPVPEANPVMKEQSKKTPLFTVNQGTPVGFEKMQKKKTFRIEDLLKPPIDLKESLIPKTQGHVWADPFKTNSESVEDCQEVQHQTRAGKTFKPAHLRTDNPAAAARGPFFQIPPAKPTEEEDKLVVDQLRRTKANVSVWGLLEASTKHREALLAALNAIQVDTRITPEELVATVAQVRGIPAIAFSDEDLPTEGASHNRALNITVGWNHLIIPLVLVDNGSGVNICTLKMARIMGLKDEDMTFQEGTTRTVKGFDNGRKTVTGEFTTTIQTGWVWTEVHFLVMDIEANFNLLLGRPWLHQNNAVASTLHQRVKFPHEGKIVVIFGDVDEVQEMANHKGKNVVPVIEPVGTLCNYTEEAINVLQARPMIREKIPTRFEYGNRRVAYLLRKHRFFPGMGLGRCHQGITEPLRSRAAALEGTFGLGYRPTKEEIQQRGIEKGKKAQARNRGEPCVSPSIDWSKQPRYSEWFVKKGHGAVIPTFSKKSSVPPKEAMVEMTEEAEAPDDTLLAGISLLYAEASSEQEAVPSINMISDESELDDTATSSLRWMTAEEYIASKTQWANAAEYRAAFFHPKKPRNEVEYPEQRTPTKKRMTAVQYREAFQLARKKKITPTVETNTRRMSADAYRLSFRQANMSVALDTNAEMVRNTAEQYRVAHRLARNPGMRAPSENIRAQRNDNPERSEGDSHESLAGMQWVNMVSEETDLQPHLFVRSLSNDYIASTNHFAGELTGAVAAGTQKKTT
ncbi:G-patch domain [Macleaya cordata]|uniref:G-patch domain n=1 Tax=Macleaya cordata TaxID=56857 RepID=A0A200QLA9_MACCD|nr:G-patch domain [Macleaya cordata]